MIRKPSPVVCFIQVIIQYNWTHLETVGKSILATERLLHSPNQPTVYGMKPVASYIIKGVTCSMILELEQLPLSGRGEEEEGERVKI